MIDSSNLIDSMLQSIVGCTLDEVSYLSREQHILLEDLIKKEHINNKSLYN